MVQVFKIMHDIDKVDKGKLFQMSECNTTRGHSLKLFKKRSRLNVRANYFTQRVVDQWDEFSPGMCCYSTISQRLQKSPE